LGLKNSMEDIFLFKSLIGSITPNCNLNFISRNMIIWLSSTSLIFMTYLLNLRQLSWLLLPWLVVSCKTFYQPAAVQYVDYRIQSKAIADNELTALLKPYADSVNATMNEVVAVSSVLLEKKQPEGNLGNLLADAMLIMARKKFNAPVNASIVNYGGIRLPSIAAGTITRGRIYELAPFDNVIVLLRLKGSRLQELLDHSAAKGGWPCAGLTYRIRNAKAIDAEIEGARLELTEEYTIAVVDYIANGGDNCDMLTSLPQQNNGYLFRDAVLDYLNGFQQLGQTINIINENRVTNAN